MGILLYKHGWYSGLESSLTDSYGIYTIGATSGNDEIIDKSHFYYDVDLYVCQ